MIFLGKHEQELLRCGRRVGSLAEILKAYNELVSTPTATKVAHTDIALQAIRDLAQQSITRVVAERIVDGLESVEADKQGGEWRRFSLTTTDRASELLSEKYSICEPRQLIKLSQLLQLSDSAAGFRNVTERDHAANERAVAVVQTLAVDAERNVGLFRYSADSYLICKLLTRARAHQRQIGRISVAVAIFVDAAEGLLPGGIGQHPWAYAQHRPRCRVDVENMPCVINHNNAVINVVEYGQDGYIGTRQARLHTSALHRVIKSIVLCFNRDVINADIALCASADSGNAPVFMFFLRQRNDRVGSKLCNELCKRMPRLRDHRSRFQQDQINNIGGIFRKFERGGSSQVSTAGKGFKLTEILCGKFPTSEIKN